MNKYFFLHIPKTAGTSLFSLFRSVLGEEQVFQIRDVNIGKQRAEALQSFGLVGGHLTYEQMQSYFERERYRFTFLRHPVERFLSMYYYYRAVEEISRDETVRMAKALDLAAYIDWLSETEEYEHVRIAQTWYMTGGLQTNTTVAERLDLAKENLASLDFVGITEHMADSLDLLCLDCCWPPATTIPQENVTARRPRLEDVDKGIIARIRDISGPDLELYAYGLGLYERKKRQLLRECVQRQTLKVQENDGNTGSVRRHEQSPESSIAVPVSRREDDEFGSREIEILAVDVSGVESCCPIISAGEEALIRIIVESHIDEDHLTAGISIKDDYGQVIFGTNTYHLAECISLQQGQVAILAFRLKMDLGEGLYHMTVALHTGGSHRQTCYHWKEHASAFTVSGFKKAFFTGIAGLHPALSFEQAELSEPLPPDVATGVALKVTDAPAEIPCSTRFNISVNLMNKSGHDLASCPPNPVHLSYHWLSVPDSKIIIFDGDRSLLLRTVAANSEGSYGLSVLSPPSQGEYILRVTLVQEQVFWFDQIEEHQFAECLVRVR